MNQPAVATALRPSPLKSPAETILSPSLEFAGALPIRTLDSVSRSTEPPALSGPASALGASAPQSAAVAPAQASARRLLVFSTAFPHLGRFRSNQPVPADIITSRPRTREKSWAVRGSPNGPSFVHARGGATTFVPREHRPSRRARIHFTPDEEERSCGRPLRCSP